MSASLDSSKYTQGEDRYIRFAEDFLDVQLSEVQKEILRSVVRNQRTLIMSGNGVGKSYIVAILKVSFIMTNVDSTVIGTSGSYSQYIDTMWRPLASLYKQAQDKYGLPGRLYEGNQPELKIDDDWFAKVVSPRDPGDLEGRHADDVLVVIEEADKEYITEEHFDSAGSSITDANDKMIAIANPPRDQSNAIYEKLQGDSRWNVIQFSSFESHNVQYDLGLKDEPLPGLVDLVTLADDWESWNNRPWPEAPEHWDGEYPGVHELKQQVQNGDLEREELLEVLRPGYEQVETAHEDDDTLDSRWYRRRAGVIPPDNAAIHRPIEVQDVDKAFSREGVTTTQTPRGLALDVARFGDYNALCAVFGKELRVLDYWNGTDHVENNSRVRSNVDSNWSAKFPVDAIGEGSGLADQIGTWYPNVIRFNAGSKPADPQTYSDCRAEAIDALGRFLAEGGSIESNRLREELMVAARVTKFKEKHVSSRGTEVFRVTPKEKIKDELGRSPDLLDAASMAVWAADPRIRKRRTVPSTW